MATKHPSSRRYPSEVKQRAIELVAAAVEPSTRWKTLCSKPEEPRMFGLTDRQLEVLAGMIDGMENQGISLYPSRRSRSM